MFWTLFYLLIAVILVIVIIAVVKFTWIDYKQRTHYRRIEPGMHEMPHQMNLFDDNHGVLNVRVVKKSGEYVESDSGLEHDTFSASTFAKSQSPVKEDVGSEKIDFSAYEDIAAISSDNQSAPEYEQNVLKKNDDVTTIVSTTTGSHKSWLNRLIGHLSGDQTVETRDATVTPLFAQSSSLPPPRPASVKTVALILLAPEGQPYSTQEVIEAASALELTLGPEGYLEYVTMTHYGDEVVYSVAHLLHPGRFDIDEIMKMELPGLLFFMHVPGPDPELESISFLLKGAAHFGKALGGTLLNEHRKPLDRETVKKLQEDVTLLEQQIWRKAQEESA